MIFPYVLHQVEQSSAIPSGEVHRPEVPVHVIGPNGSVEVSGLIDTGADHVFLPVALAELLGIEIDDSGAESAEGAGGHELRIWPGKVELEVSDGSEMYRWDAHVGFIEAGDDPAAAYLGHAGFLEHFVAKFDYGKRLVELVGKS